MKPANVKQQPVSSTVGSDVLDGPRASFSVAYGSGNQKTFAARPEAAALPGTAREQNAAGFSLTEVTISIGIIVAVVLPLVAMLAGSGQTATESKDRFAATQLTRSIEGQLRYSAKNDAFVLQGASTQEGGAQQDTVTHRTLLTPPGPGGTSTVYLGYDRAARFVREIEENEYDRGLGRSEEEIFYLAEVEIATSGDGFSVSLDAPRLYRTKIIVGQPAFTAEENRATETLTTLVSAQ